MTSVVSIRNSSNQVISTTVYDATRYYTYKFRLRVKAAADSRDLILSGLRVDGGLYLKDYVPFVSFETLSGTTFSTSQKNAIINGTGVNLIYGDSRFSEGYVSGHAGHFGYDLFQVVTTKRVNTFELMFAHRQWAPGLCIYEDDIIVFDDVVNQGSHNAPSGHWYTYPLNNGVKPVSIPDSLGVGWVLIRQVPGGSQTWFSTSHSKFTDMYDQTELLFATGDFSTWLVTTRGAVCGSTTGASGKTFANVKSSHGYSELKVWNRSDTAQDPTVTLDDTTMYMENSHTQAGVHASGMYVFAKSTTNTVHQMSPMDFGSHWKTHRNFETEIGTGWRMVRHIPGGSSQWFTGNTFFSEMNDDDELLFTSGDSSIWFVTTRYEMCGVLRSSWFTPLKTYLPGVNGHRWFRNFTGSDPIIAYYPPSGTIRFYAEGSNTDTSQLPSSGMYVYARPTQRFATQLLPIKSEVGSGWTLIRHIPGNKGSWFNDFNKLSDVHNDDELLFTTGDCHRWFITDRNTMCGVYPREGSFTPIKAYADVSGHRWHRDGNRVRDPIIVLRIHNYSGTGVTENVRFYAEGSDTGGLNYLHSSGMYVYTRPVYRYPGKYKAQTRTGGSVVEDYVNIFQGTRSVDNDDGTTVVTVTNHLGDVSSVLSTTVPNAANTQTIVLDNKLTGILRTATTTTDFVETSIAMQRTVALTGLLDQFSQDYSSLNGGYGCKHLFTDYLGPHVKIRKADNTEMEVVFDDKGVSEEYAKWIQGAVAYVVTWYDQSGNGNHASAQGEVTFDYVHKRVVLGADGYFQMPDGTVPYNATQTAEGSRPYTFIVDHGTTASNNGALISGGTFGSSGKCNSFRRAGIGYGNDWWNRGFWKNSTPIYNHEQVVVARYVPNGGRDIYIPEPGVDKNILEHTSYASWHNATQFKNTIGVTYGSDDTTETLFWEGDIYTALIYEAALDHVQINGIAGQLR